jgi:methionyl-tRNA formyltransferase
VDQQLVERAYAGAFREAIFKSLEEQSAIESKRIPGTITETGSINAGGRDTVEILEVQPEGKRPMSLNDFRNGRPWRAGMRLESII